MDFLEEIKANFWELDTITHKSIAKKTKYSQSTVRVYTHALVEAGYLTVELEKRENVYEFKEKPENRLYIETNDIEQHKKELIAYLNSKAVPDAESLVNELFMGFEGTNAESW